MLAVIAVEKQGIVSLVENQIQDGRHRAGWDCLLLGTLHAEDDLANAIGLEERFKSGVDFILFDERPVKVLK